MAHHNTGRRNAAKPESEKSLSQIQIRVKDTEKSLIVRNLKSGETLRNFMMTLAIKEATRRQSK